MLCQVVGDLEPLGFASHEDVAGRPNSWIVIQYGDRNAVLACGLDIVRQRLVTSRELVQDRRPASSTEAAEHPGRRFVEVDEVVSSNPSKVILVDPNTAAECGTVLFPAIETMAVQRAL
jgi:hypothetical protein